MDHHEAATTDISGARIGHRHGKTGRHRGVDRIAATLEHIGADPRRGFLLRNHHAVFGGNGVNRIGGGRRIKAAVLLLRIRRHAECNKERDGGEN